MKAPYTTAASVALVLAVVYAMALFASNSISQNLPTTKVSTNSESASTRHLQSRTYCGCALCTTEVFNTQAPAGAGADYTCGKRMKFLQKSVSNIDACRQVANEFPDICGVCNTDICAPPGSVADTFAPEETMAPSSAGTSGRDESTAAPTSGGTTTLLPLIFMGQSGIPSSAYPLGKCQGDCDTDSDCQAGLICYPRDPHGAVPGCSGEDPTEVDYCISPYDLGIGTTPVAAPVASPVAAPQPTAGRTEPTAMTATMEPTVTVTTIMEPMPTATRAPTTAATDEPTSTTTEEPTAPANEDDEGRAEDEVFRLKIYWEEGYDWQNEEAERKWCLRCVSDEIACNPGRRVFATNCDKDDLVTEWELVYGVDGSFQVKDSNSNNCLTIPDDTQEPMIVDTCKADNIQQLYFAQRGEAEWGDKFELNSAWIPEGCIGVTHHPRDRETSYIWECAVTRRWTTGLWNFY